MSSFNKSRRQAFVALADGTVFRGYAFGAERGVVNAALGEMVFNTSLFGYQEILTDPSYAGQVMCFTTPQIGNVGCNPEDNESKKVFVEGVIVRNLSPVVSNFRAKESLSDYLERAGVMGVSDIDTRALTSHLRTHGAQMGALACGDKINPDELVAKARAADYGEMRDYVREVSTKQPYSWMELPWTLKDGVRKLREEETFSRPHVVALDCGIKNNILSLLLGIGFRVTAVPCTYSAEQIMALRPDALFLSNGPGDPAKLGYIVDTVKALLGKIPTFGICLGHQILAQAVGGKTYKLKFGHRGGNHPVRDESTKKVEITVQNHGYAVDAKSLPKDVFVSHVNLNDNTVEGLSLPELKAFSVQYHPESSPGPHDAQYLFKRFFELVVK